MKFQEKSTACSLAYISTLANLGSLISERLRRIFLKLDRLTKFGMINRFMEKNFCFNEKHKKLQFCVTSSKRSIGPIVLCMNIEVDLEQRPGRISRRGDGRVSASKHYR